MTTAGKHPTGSRPQRENMTRAVQIAPARLLASGMPETVDDVVVMLDGKQTFARIDPAGLMNPGCLIPAADPAPKAAEAAP